MTNMKFEDCLFPERDELALIPAATADKISTASMLYELGMAEPHGAVVEDAEAPAQVAKMTEYSVAQIAL